ncbi:hypothetical protein N2152v2_006431 [Parachlorella kessleri]
MGPVALDDEHGLHGNEDEYSHAPPADRKLKVNGRQRRSLLLGLPVFSPVGRVARWWSVLTTLLDLTYTAFLVPLSVAFLTQDWDVHSRLNFLVVSDLIGNIVYLADLLMGFLLGFVVLWDARWVPITDGRLVAWFYLQHGMLIINAVAVLPLFVQIVTVAIGDSGKHVVKLVFLLRLLRLVRVVMIIKSLSQPGDRDVIRRVISSWISATALLIFKAVFSLLILLNLMGCLWWAVARIQGIENSWAAHIGDKDRYTLVDAPDALCYLYSGYGDITPYTPLEVGVSLLYMFVGVAYFGYLINIVNEVLTSTRPSKHAARLHDKMQSLDAWMSERRMAAPLRSKLRKHFMRLWMQDMDSDEAHFYSQLPAGLRGEVRQELESHPMFQAGCFKALSPAADAALMAVLRRLATPVSIFPGHVLYSKGDQAHHIHVLDEGLMCCDSEAGWPAVHFRGPAVLGLAGLFSKPVPECAHHLQAATARTGCHLWRVGCAEAARRLHERHPEVLLELGTLLAQRTGRLLQLCTEEDLDSPSLPQRQWRAVRRLEKLAQSLGEHIASLQATPGVKRHPSPLEQQHISAGAEGSSIIEQAIVAAAAGAGGAAAAEPGQQEKEREAELALQETEELEEKLAMAAAAAAAAAAARPKTCAVCGKEAPLRCTGCHSRAYCGKSCQLRDWKSGHKQQCKRLRAQQTREAALQRVGSVHDSSAAAEVTSGDEDTLTSSRSGGASGGPNGSSSSAESYAAAPIPTTVIYPYDKFKQLLEEPWEGRPVGLKNIGNTCFANSLLQALLATQPLSAYLLSGQHGRGCSRGGASRGGTFCVLCDMEALAQQAHSAGSSSCSAAVDTRQLLKNIRRIGKQFRFGHQEDSHELFVQLLDCMEAVLLEEAGGKAKFDLRSRETTLVHHVFGGYLRNQVACLSCGHVSKSYESSLSLVLELPHRAPSLEAALQHFTKRERLDGDNKYRCDRCKAYVPADKSTQFEVGPNVLQICLKRFGIGRFGGKNKSHVSFPEQLDLGPFMADDCLDEQPAQYSLYAVVVHQGHQTTYGHYYSLVRQGEKWFRCNDHSVTQVTAHSVLQDTADAYLLFYQRQTPREILATHPTSPPTPTKPAAEPLAKASAEPSVTTTESDSAGSAVLGRIQTAPAALSHMLDASGSAAGAAAARLGRELDASSSSASSSCDFSAAAARLAGPPPGMPEQFHPSVSMSNLHQPAGQPGDAAGSEAFEAAEPNIATAAAATAAPEETEAAGGSREGATPDEALQGSMKQKPHGQAPATGLGKLESGDSSVSHGSSSSGSSSSSSRGALSPAVAQLAAGPGRSSTAAEGGGEDTRLLVEDCFTAIVEAPAENGGVCGIEPPAENGSPGSPGLPAGTSSIGRSNLPAGNGSAGGAEPPSGTGNRGSPELLAENGDPDCPGLQADPGNVGRTEPAGENGSAGSLVSPADTSRVGSGHMPLANGSAGHWVAASHLEAAGAVVSPDKDNGSTVYGDQHAAAAESALANGHHGNGSAVKQGHCRASSSSASASSNSAVVLPYANGVADAGPKALDSLQADSRDSHSNAAGSCSTAAVCRDPMPAYFLQQRRLDDGTKVVRVSFDLPGVCGENIELRVSSDGRQLWLGARPYSATLKLPAPVLPAERSVKWVKRTQRLIATFDVHEA